MNNNRWIKELLSFLNLTHEKEEPVLIHESIEKSIVFKGTNLWILIFAILLASVGLNMNSTAVIIGAMLISPLMGPINGMGYSIATYNFPLFRKSLKNLSFAVIAGLVTSTMYFVLSPIRTEHSELLSRTSPTIYDVAIALFGGLAGIVAISSKSKGNVIPGVAIATALMPPLCTAGYGISIGNWYYFFGAMYLFLINSVFIALSAMLVSQLLKLPRQSHLLTREIKNKNIAIASVIAITVLPSIYFGYTLIKKERFRMDAKVFIQTVSYWEGNYLLKEEIDVKSNAINLVYGGNGFDKETINRLYNQAEKLNLEGVKINIQQGLKLNDVDHDVELSSEIARRTGEIEKLKLVINDKEKSIDSLNKIPYTGEYLLSEIKSIFPQIESCVYSESVLFVDSIGAKQNVSIVYFDLSKDISDLEKKKVHSWLMKRLKTEHVILKF